MHPLTSLGFFLLSCPCGYYATSIPAISFLNLELLKERIGSGGVYCIQQWADSRALQTLRKYAESLETEGCFVKSGVSYQTSVHASGIAVPVKDRLICDEIPDHLYNKDLADVLDRIENLRVQLADAFDRPTMQDAALDHESYFSISENGCMLPRHMDERHEGIKDAECGWQHRSRRSISWLLYLNGETWDESDGGQLRAFQQKKKVLPDRFGCCGSHEGNLQVGWLNSECWAFVKPVYMLTWDDDRTANTSTSTSTSSCDDANSCSSSSTCSSRRLSSLYVLNTFRRKLFMTTPFEVHPPYYPGYFNGDNDEGENNVQGSGDGNFLSLCLSNMVTPSSTNDKINFSLVEDFSAWSRGEDPAGTVAVDYIPSGGTLCLFDSVALPHEVLSTRDGKRIALGGWFHERVILPKKEK